MIKLLLLLLVILVNPTFAGDPAAGEAKFKSSWISIIPTTCNIKRHER